MHGTFSNSSDAHATQHKVDVFKKHAEISERKKADLKNILKYLTDRPNWSVEDINKGENNTQGILGYVVRWIDQGVGCSKVPDINIGLMEDRATLRISSQHIKLVTQYLFKEQVMKVLKKMAVIDQQNSKIKL